MSAEVGEEAVQDVEAAPNDGPEYTPGQMYKLSAVYDFLARLIPVEGRDYSVNVRFGDGDSLSVSMEPHTPFGKVWCSYCMDMMRKSSQSGQSGQSSQKNGGPR